MAAILEIDNVTKVYPSGVRANETISLTASEGEIFGLLGPNGAGKTTLVSQVLGLLCPTAGSITIDGVDVVRHPAVARRKCSYQPQSTVPIDGLSPREAIELAGRIRGVAAREVRRRTSDLLAALDLGPWERRTHGLS